MSLFLALCAPLAMAEDSEFVGAEAPPEPAEEEKIKPETTLSAELGGIYTTGNVSLYAVNGGVAAGHRWSQNKLSLLTGLNIGAGVPDGDENGTIDVDERGEGFKENARRFHGEARYDRFFSETDSLYFLSGAFHDVFAGYDLRSHQQLGYSKLLLKDERSEIRGEVGFDYAQEFYVDGVDPDFANIFAGRMLLAGSHAFSDSVGITNVLEVYENILDFRDLRVLNTLTLSSALSSTFSVKLSHALIFDNVPVENFQPLDQTTLVTLVATIL